MVFGSEYAPQRQRQRVARKPRRGFRLPGTPMEYAAVLAIIAVALLGTQCRSDRYETLLRDSFHLPPAVAFTEFRYPNSRIGGSLEALIEFTDDEFRAYVSQLDNPNVWRSQPLTYRGETIDGPYSPDALKWQPLPKPAFAGNRRVRYGHLPDDRISKAESGRVLCTALRQKPGKRKSDYWWQAPKGYEHRFPLETPKHLERFTALNCAELGRSERPVGYVLGVLNDRTKTLYITIR